MRASITVGGQTTTFAYDGDGKLTKKVKPDGTYTLYLGIYELDLSSGGAVTKKTSYYPGGAMRVDIVGGANTLYYTLKDHLRSASVLLDASGNIVTNGEQRYYPFGENRLATFDLKTDHLFTGQLSVGLGGIYSYGARFYSPRLGRFLSADTVVPNFADPQSLNRFAYVRNNPLKYIDPTGHTVLCDAACEEEEDSGWDPPSSGGGGSGNGGGGGSGGGDYCLTMPWECEEDSGSSGDNGSNGGGEPSFPITDPVNSDAREDYAQTVLDALENHSDPNIWWRSEGMLDVRKIKAWILDREAGELWHLQSYEEPIGLMAGIINFLIGNEVNADNLALFTVVFDPVQDGWFDEKDWALWLIPPTQPPTENFIDNYTGTPPVVGNDMVLNWWRSNEGSRNDVSYASYALPNGDIFYFGTGPQFCAATTYC